MLFCFTLLVLSVLLISGWSDASGAVTACVSVRSLPEENAIRLAAASTLVGSVVMFLVNPAIVQTFYGAVDLGEDATRAMLSLCAALLATVLWSGLTRGFGLPTSESHALVSAMSGAAVAATGRITVIHPAAWGRILLGLAISIFLSFFLAFLCNRTLHALLAKRNRRRALSRFGRSQRFSACWSAAMTGAQDCQKFMGVYLLGLSICGIGTESARPLLPSLILLSSTVMAMGTMLGSSHVIKKLGRDMVSLDAPDYSAAGAASTAVLTLCTCLGLPASITHTRAAAFVGAGARNRRRVDLRIVLQIFGAWLLTFPICALLGFLLTIGLLIPFG